MSATKNPTQLEDLRHSCAHLLAAAVMDLWPSTKRAIGPAIENGFYFDFEFENSISAEDFSKIEQKMHEIVKTWDSFELQKLSAAEAKADYPDNPYKHELIDEFSEGGTKPVSFYKSGNYRDLCKGGHIDNPKEALKHFKLLSVAGAYWRGNEKNTMLTRIYGTCFPSRDELKSYLTMLEEAKKRDHRKLGTDLDLFVFSDLVGKGLPLFTPRGALLRELLNEFSQELRLNVGFERVWIPHITKKELYQTSGHWDKFGDELFLVESQETNDELVMKPMNCPHHQQIYASRMRSYKELPIKYLETTTIYRDEKAGELLGLSRVRSVTQDDSHTFCTPEQIPLVYQELIEIVKKFYDALGMKYRARLSFKDPAQSEKYLGEESLWQLAQDTILDIAQKNKLDYYVAEGEAAFYGPKIDFMVSDALGREWQLATPQLDFVQPKRFGLTYTNAEGKEQTPVMIHFALMGSLERFLSVYIEHTAGIFPAWLAPTQVAIIPISESEHDYAQQIYSEMKQENLRAVVDYDNKTLSAKIRHWTLQKVPYLCIIGQKESQNKTLSLRSRDGKDLGIMSLYEFIKENKTHFEKPI
ncbi:MAG: Threonine--tRNA ligase [Microgenomates bacterium OLB23]|nr:MAG: Threonine--tRNA ligase [Microgenomates bacterium OLB23]